MNPNKSHKFDNRSPFSRNLPTVASLAILALTFAGCATTKHPNGDPFEKWNRSFHSLNHKLDNALLKPVAEGYAKSIPKPVQHGVSNFFSNLGEINVILNDLLQGKFEDGLDDFGRLLANSTLGIGGILDVATPMGLPKHKEDFGQTLGVWGVGEGAYLTLPILGPSTIRDEPARLVTSVTSVLFYVNEAAITFPLGVLGTISRRAELINSIKEVDEAAVDRYIFVREAYRGDRMFQIYDGDPPFEDLFEDDFDFEDEEEAE